MKKFRIAFTLILLASLLAALLGLVRVPSAHAQTTFTVTNCSNDSQLQSYVAQANIDNDGDTITFNCGGSANILLTRTLTISGSMTLTGPTVESVTLDGQNQVQVLSVNSGVNFTLNTLTIAHGLGAGNVFGFCCSGGGLFNSGTVNITNSTFANNSAPNGAGGGFGGGGLFNFGGTVNISNSTFTNNLTNIGGGGLFNFGGTVSISNSTFANNPANEGGGLYNEGTVSISNSTFANNSASLAAGGLFNSSGTVSISNSTFAYNSASGGGGLVNFGTVNISNSIFVYNSSGSSGGGLINNGPLSIGGSIVANNSAPGGGNCAAGRGGVTSDQGYNLESATDCGFTGTGDLQSIDPRLASALANNGGPTQTIALEPDSPAIDRIPKSICPPTDQRGVSRPQGSTSCDIGAFELKATEGITELIAIVNSFGLSSGLQTSLDAKLEDALTSINAGQTATACSDLADFINQVKAKTNKGISSSQATQLIKAATNLQGVLGC